MTDMPDARDIAARWLSKAANDLLAATHTLGLGAECPYDIVCFHCQQCVEKCLKGVLASAGSDPPRTHDIRALVRLVPVPVTLPLTEDEQDLLSDYAVTVRYPSDDDETTREDAETATVMARRVYEAVRARLAVD
jgi:HEPN domain-containing protein